MARIHAKGATPRAITTAAAAGRVNPLGFFKEIITELRKAVWPSREETVRLTYIVLLISSIVGLFLWAVDKGFFEFFKGLVF